MKPWFYAGSRMLVGLLLRIWVRMTHHDRDRIPATGPVLLVSNHSSFMDPPLVGCTAVRPVHFFARSTLAKVPVLGRVITWQGTLFVDREGSARAGLEVAGEALDAGGMVCIFPEGTRSPDGRVQPFKRGAMLLLKRHPAQVVPVGIRGSFASYSRHVKFPRPGRCSVHYGEPMSAEQVLAPGGVDRLWRQVRELAGDFEDADVGAVRVRPALLGPVDGLAAPGFSTFTGRRPSLEPCHSSTSGLRWLHAVVDRTGRVFRPRSSLRVGRAGPVVAPLPHVASCPDASACL